MKSKTAGVVTTLTTAFLILLSLPFVPSWEKTYKYEAARKNFGPGLLSNCGNGICEEWENKCNYFIDCN